MEFLIQLTEGNEDTDSHILVEVQDVVGSDGFIFRKQMAQLYQLQPGNHFHHLLRPTLSEGTLRSSARDGSGANCAPSGALVDNFVVDSTPPGLGRSVGGL
jgi:hypothetical protein